MSIRYWLARPYLSVHRLRNRFYGKSDEDGFRILIFHDIPPTEFVAFDKFLAWLMRETKILSPDQASAWLAGERFYAGSSSRPPCLLSFDDGFVSNLKLARAVLASHKIKGLFFICPGLVELSESGENERIQKHIFSGQGTQKVFQKNQRLMNWDEVLSLRNDGHVVGNHGMLHQRLSEMPPSEYEAEICESADLLESKIGEKIIWYAYAFGDVGSISGSALKTIHGRHQYCRSGIRGLNGGSVGSSNLYADHIDLAAPELYWQLVLEGAFDNRYTDARVRFARMAG